MVLRNGDEAFFKCKCGGEWKGIFLKDRVVCPYCHIRNGHIGASEVRK
jgi:hypothetical protein